jgi:hypothetical protein
MVITYCRPLPGGKKQSRRRRDCQIQGTGSITSFVSTCNGIKITGKYNTDLYPMHGILYNKEAL